MNRASIWVPLGLAALAAGFIALGACNSGTDDCPDKSTIVPDDSCSDEHLQCAFDLSTPAPACDGTTTVIASSCTCNKGHWDCPSPVDCSSADAGDEAAATDDGGDSGPTDDAAADEAGDAAADAPDGG